MCRLNPAVDHATTANLLHELIFRFRYSTPDDAVRMSLQHWLDALPADVLDYRQADDHDPAHIDGPGGDDGTA